MKSYRTTPSAIKSRFDSFDRVKVQIAPGGFGGSIFADVKSARQLPNKPDTIYVREKDGILTIVFHGDMPSYIEPSF